MPNIHSSHPNIVNRLKIAKGHLAKVISMIEEGKSCLEVSQQMQSVCSALLSAKKIFVQDHIQGCIEFGEMQNKEEVRQKIEELKEITKYL